MAYRAAVCDDDPKDAEYVSGLTAQWAQSRGIELECAVFSSAEAFLFHYAEDKNFDLLLLDVEMPGTDGVTLAKTVRQENEAVQIVFITGYSDYIVKRTLAEFEAELDEQFFRVGRGMILNLKQIRRVTKKEVFLADGTVLPLPRGSYEPLNRAIIERT